VNSIVKGSAYDLPFIDSQFDLVYTAGVLIHLSDTEKAMKEIYRVSSKYILSIEYFDDKERKIEYRDEVYCSAKPFDRLWLDNFDLDLVELGDMKDFGLDDGTDFSRNCKYAIFKKP
jgi:SAM-dependent methyltransferase